MRGHPPLLETPKRGILTVTRPTKPESEIYLIPKIGGNRARREEPCSSQPDSDELFEMASLFPAYDQAADDRMGQPARVLIPKIGGG